MTTFCTTPGCPHPLGDGQYALPALPPRNKKTKTEPTKIYSSPLTAQAPSSYDNFIRMAEKISAVALGVFAFCTSFELFLPFFAGGIALGLYQYFHTPQGKRVADCGGGACGQIIEKLTGVKLPRLVSLAADVAIIGAHIEHHPIPFVPVVALGLGNWFGDWAGKTLVTAFPKLSPAPI